MLLRRWHSLNKPPDVVITDVIMPDQDGYSVCSQIKQNPQYSETPVVLMSGVVNKSVADKAVSVKADELIRKPFQPQELIGRVKSLLEPKGSTPAPALERPASSNALSNLFSPPPVPVAPRPVTLAAPVPATPESAWRVRSPKRSLRVNPCSSTTINSNRMPHRFGRLRRRPISRNFALRLPIWICS